MHSAQDMLVRSCPPLMTAGCSQTNKKTKNLPVIQNVLWLLISFNFPFVNHQNHSVPRHPRVGLAVSDVSYRCRWYQFSSLLPWSKDKKTPNRLHRDVTICCPSASRHPMCSYSFKKNKKQKTTIATSIHVKKDQIFFLYHRKELQLRKNFILWKGSVCSNSYVLTLRAPYYAWLPRQCVGCLSMQKHAVLIISTLWCHKGQKNLTNIWRHSLQFQWMRRPFADIRSYYLTIKNCENHYGILWK